ncbi:hypothetical protein [Sinorhizobium fredii]|uniref:hypothetical protein n=1 Tax=Rhizobium fredii TaxID=380 RepID=UPI001295B59F|nr:hypothetical protein [Sinorhizobium fredii]MQW95244.1 hypothetical protein [Sinorhizobium fredii]
MAMLVAHLLASGYKVRLLTGDEDDARRGSGPRGPWRERCKRLSYEPVHSLHDVLSQVARTDLVVVPRFHNVVAALMAGKLVISLSYAPKMICCSERWAWATIASMSTASMRGSLIEQLSRPGRTFRHRPLPRREVQEEPGPQDEFLLSTVLLND